MTPGKIPKDTMTGDRCQFRGALYKSRGICYDISSPLLHTDVTKAPFFLPKKDLGFWATMQLQRKEFKK